MKKLLFLSAATLLVMSAVSCKNNNKKQDGVPAYTVVEAPQVNLDEFPVDDEGYIVLFDGKTRIPQDDLQEAVSVPYPFAPRSENTVDIGQPGT